MGEDCLIWRGSTASGYGAKYIDGKQRYAHRLALIDERVDVEGELVLHECGERLCVNPDHLYVGGRSENANDAVEHGTWPTGEDNGSSKLTDDEVTEIREKYDNDDITQEALGEKYGVTRSMIGKIVRRESRTR